MVRQLIDLVAVCGACYLNKEQPKLQLVADCSWLSSTAYGPCSTRAGMPRTGCWCSASSAKGGRVLPAALQPNVVCSDWLQVLSDDVAVEFPCDFLLHSAEKQLHVVLHLPDAHHLHGVCVCQSGHCTTTQ